MAPPRIRLVFAGKPKTKDNRAFIGRDHRSGRPVIRVPDTYKAYEETVAKQALAQLSGDKRFPIRKPVRIRVTALRFYYPYMPTNNDLFNAPKSFCDALNGIVWEDDSQIYEAGGLVKAKDPENPRVELEIETLEGQ